MARLVRKEDHKKENTILAVIDEIVRIAAFLYLICMFGIFPLYYKNQYESIGTLKFEFFWKTSLVFLAVSILIYAVKKLMEIYFYHKTSVQKSYHNKKRNNFSVDWKNKVQRYIKSVSFLDKALLCYGLCVIISFLCSDFKEFAFRGASGWEMGLCSQLIFIGLYLILSRQEDLMNSFTIIHLLASAAVFLFGILHRFEIDPLGMYQGLNVAQKTEFLSTLGQATWFSSYVCTTFAIGLICFYLREEICYGLNHKTQFSGGREYEKLITWLTGIYTVLSFGILVVQNSDSAFMALAGIMLLLGYYSLRDIYKWIRFWQIMTILWGTFAGMGILQRIFADRIIPLDTLSLFFSQSIVTWILFGISLGAYFIFHRWTKKDCKKQMAYLKKGYQIFLGILAAGIVLVIVFIYLNTKGYLLEWFGYQSQNNYLLFDYHWGSNRGSSWMITWQEFWNLPFKNKLFGVGPDSFSAYLYSNPQIQELLHNLWGNLRLTNAHNEYLNSLLCYGIAGVTAWLTILIGGVRYFYIKAKENPFMIAFALCIVGYACHNIFCYQQVCCTPFLFMILGMGESLTKSANFHTIK